MRVRDPRVPRPEARRPPEVAVVRALIPPQPGTLEGMDFDEVRTALGTTEPDGTIHQALVDEGLEVEDD